MFIESLHVNNSHLWLRTEEDSIKIFQILLNIQETETYFPAAHCRPHDITCYVLLQLLPLSLALILFCISQGLTGKMSIEVETRTLQEVDQCLSVLSSGEGRHVHRVMLDNITRSVGCTG
jgi:hypothetical protein